MRLIELRANKESFHTITFNERGVSIIRATQVSEDTKNTYNSIGKSLLVYLIHFCLGASTNEELKNKLPDWEFYLDFKIGDTLYTSTRNTENQDNIWLNDIEFKVSEFNNHIQSLVFFNIPENFKYISFRSLISRFIRPQKASYNEYNKYIAKEKEYQQLINNGFLLGLDIEKINKKRELKEQWDDIVKKKKNIENDPVMQEFFTENTDRKKIDIEILHLEKRIEKLSTAIENFKVAEDYDYIKQEADEISSRLRDYKNRRTAIQNTIKNIDKNLDIKPDIKIKDIQKLYNEAKYEISDSIKKRLEDVEEFNKKLLGNRKARLLEEKRAFEKQLSEIEGIIRRLGKEEDQKLYLLKSTGSLEEYSKLNEQWTQLQNKYNKLKNYKELLESYNSKIDEIKEQFLKENTDTNRYLKENELIKKRNIEVFNSFADQFYQNKPSGILIENNEGENLNRFNIEATIDSDSGDAVNNVKIFCFDWTLLKNQNNHNVRFIFHDSRLISEIDPRQIATMFYIAYSSTKKNDFQYIITTNQKELDSIKDIFSEDEYQKYILDNVIEDLTDESDEGKLLGITVDLNYEK
ncbi:MAG: DUF2326 domain-containing protein [Candidatus Woesearchaeota archaeon]